MESPGQQGARVLDALELHFRGKTGQERRQPPPLAETGGFTHFDNVVEIRGNRLKMLRRPEDIVFYSAKTTNPSVSP